MHKEQTIRIEVITKKGSTEAIFAIFKERGYLNVDQYQSVINADIPFDQVKDLTGYNDLLFIRPVYKPYIHSGNALSQGDAAQEERRALLEIIHDVG